MTSEINDIITNLKPVLRSDVSSRLGESVIIHTMNGVDCAFHDIPVYQARHNGRLIAAMNDMATIKAFCAAYQLRAGI